MKSMLKKIISFLIVFSVVFAILPAFTVQASAEASDEAFFKYLTENIFDYKEKIDFSYYAKLGKWNINDVSEKIKLYYLITPELFFVNNNMVLEYDEKNYIYKIKIDYLYTKNKTEEMLRTMKKAAVEAVSGITDDMTDAEKALYVHDYIVINNSYDHSSTKRSAYNCLVEHSSVCQGYALAYLYIMRDILGIDCSVAVSDSQNHVWNYIKIDNEWYHVDLTADDLSFLYYGGKKYDGFGEISHKNLLLSDPECKRTTDLHKNWTVFGLPAAKSSKYDNYFWKESRSIILRYDGLWYYVIVDPDCSGLNYSKGKSHEITSLICTYDFKTGNNETIKNVDSTWYLYRDQSTGKKISGSSWYKRSFLKLAMCGSYIYYNTSDSIYRFSLKTGKTKKIYSLNKRNMSIFSIAAVSDKKIKICYKRDMSYKDKYISLTFK